MESEVSLPFARSWYRTLHNNQQHTKIGSLHNAIQPKINHQHILVMFKWTHLVHFLKLKSHSIIYTS